jgi:hypothetical protein
MKKTTTKRTKKTITTAAPPVPEPAESSPAPALEPDVTVAEAKPLSIQRATFCPLCNVTHAHPAYYVRLWQRRPVKTEVDDAWFYRHARMLAHEALAQGGRS